MRRTVNFKAVVILLVAGAALGAAVHFVHAYQVKRNADALYGQALQAEQEGKKDLALQLLKEYLGLKPADTDAREKLAILLNEQAGYNYQARERAFMEMEQVLRQDPSRQKVRNLAAESAILLDRYGDAITHLKVLLDEKGEKGQPKDPADRDDYVRLLQWLARCETKKDHPDQARGCYQTALRVKDLPRDKEIELSLEYAYFLREKAQQTEADEADRLVELLVAKHGSQVLARLGAARYCKQYALKDRQDHKPGDKLAEAAEHVRVALEEHPPEDHKPELYLVGAEIARVSNDQAGARKYLEQGYKLYPKDPRMSLELARVELQQGRRREALGYLQPTLETLPANPEHLWILANLLLDIGGLDKDHKDKVDQMIARLRQMRDGYPVAQCLEARLDMQADKWGEARQKLDRLGAVKPLTPELRKHITLYLAQCYERLGNFDQALLAYKQALTFDPFFVPALRGQALANAALGQVDEAIKGYPDGLLKASNLRLELLKLKVTQVRRRPANERNWAEVDKNLGELTFRDSGVVGALAVQLSGPAEVTAASAAASAAALANVTPPPREVWLLQVDVLLAQGKNDEARRMVEAATAADPKDLVAWRLKAELAARQLLGPEATLLGVVDQAEAATGKRVDWQLLRARHWLQQGKQGKDEGLSELKKIEATLGQFPAADQNRLRLALADAYQLLKEGAEAERLWRDALGKEENKNNLALRLLLFDRALKEGGGQEAQNLLADMKRIEGGRGAYTIYCEAYLLLKSRPDDKGAYRQARQALDEAIRQKPSWPLPYVLQADVYEKENKKDDALQSYQLAIDRGETQLRVYHRAMQLYYERQQYAEAARVLQLVPPQALTSSKELARLAAAIMFRNPGAAFGPGQEEARKKAYELARGSVSKDSQDYQDWLYLGQMALAAGDRKEAEGALRKAVALGDQAPDAWVSLVVFLVNSNNRKAALEEVENAKKKLPPDKRSLTLAVCYEALGQMNEAGTSYKEAVDQKPNDPIPLQNLALFYARNGRRDLAEPRLEELLQMPKKKIDVSETTLAWARRELALTLAVRGRQAEFERALKLLDENPRTKTGDLTVEDRRVEALVLATQPSRRKTAIEKFVELSGDRSTPPEMRYMLVQLYELDRQFDKAQSELKDLAATQVQNPVFLNFAVRRFLEYGDTAEAEACLNRLKLFGRKGFDLVELEARLLHKKKKTADAVQLLKEYAKAKDARLDLAASLLDQLDRPDEAERMYKDFINGPASKPESVLLLAQHYGRRNRLADAFAICEKAWNDKVPAHEVARACLVILRTAKAGEGYKEQVEAWVDGAIQKDPKNVPLMAYRAELLDYLGRYDAAVTGYRQILKVKEQDKNVNVLALNNLAYLLALREEDLPEALAMIDRAIAILGPVAELLDTRAVVLLKINKGQDAAIRDLEEALRQTPTPLRYFHLAQAKLQARQRAEAKENWKLAIDRGLKPADLHPLELESYRKLERELNSQ